MRRRTALAAAITVTTSLLSGALAVAATTRSPTIAPYDCRGSGDGMAEAYKHAREKYCESHRG